MPRPGESVDPIGKFYCDRLDRFARDESARFELDEDLPILSDGVIQVIVDTAAVFRGRVGQRVTWVDVDGSSVLFPGPPIFITEARRALMRALWSEDAPRIQSPAFTVDGVEISDEEHIGDDKTVIVSFR